MGPTGVALVTPKPWVVGILARQLWSVAGPSDRSNVSQPLLQLFVNYNLPEGLVSDECANHHDELERDLRQSVEFADRRRRRQDLQDRRTTDQRRASGI